MGDDDVGQGGLLESDDEQQRVDYNNYALCIYYKTSESFIERRIRKWQRKTIKP